MNIIKSESGYFTLVVLVSSSLVCSAGDGQVSRKSPPRFEDYPINEIYKAVPAAPKITTPAQRKYRTRIREGVEKGREYFKRVLETAKSSTIPVPTLPGR